MGLLDLLKRPATKLKVGELRAALAADDADAERARERVEALKRQRSDNLLDAGDDELDQIEKQIRQAVRDVDRLERARARAGELLAEAEAKEADAERRKRYAEASNAVERGRAALQRYPAAAGTIIEIIEELARAEMVVEAANRDLPEGVEPLPRIEDTIRGHPAIPAKELKREVVDLKWHVAADSASSDGTPKPLTAEEVRRVEKLSSDTGIIRNWRGQGETPVFLRRITRVTTSPRVNAVIPPPLAQAVELPGFRGGEPPFWGDRNRIGIGHFERHGWASVLADAERSRAEDRSDVDRRYYPDAEVNFELEPHRDDIGRAITFDDYGAATNSIARNLG